MGVAARPSGHGLSYIDRGICLCYNTLKCTRVQCGISECGVGEIDRPVTLKDVAERSGFSLRTVKKVFQGDGGVRPQTREHILAAASELGYVKNQMASILASNRQRKIAIVIGNSKYFFPEMQEGFYACAESLRDYKIGIEFFVPEDNTAAASRTLLEQIRGQEDVDAVILHAASMTGLDGEIGRLLSGGRPVFTIGADAPYSGRTCFVGPKAYESGRIAAQVMANYMGRQGNVVIINQIVEQMQTAERSRGFIEAVREQYPHIQIHRIIVDQPSRYREAVTELAAQGQADGLLCTDADCYIAGQVLRDLGRKDIVITGFDLTAEAGALMKEGYIQVILSQNPRMQAEIALRRMCEYLTMGTPVQANLFTPVDIVVSESLRYQQD